MNEQFFSNSQLNDIIINARIKSLVSALSEEQKTIYKEHMSMHKETLLPIIEQTFQNPSLTSSFLEAMEKI